MKITVTNGKGGTGKTTLTTFFAEYLFRRGKRVLLIDLDPNCCISEVYNHVLKEETTRLLLTGQKVAPYSVKKNEKGGEIAIIPSELDLSMLSNVKDTQLKFQIKSQGLEKNYDYVFIDPPGTWNAHNRNAVFAADTIVVCGKCSKLDFAATKKYMAELEQCCLDSEIFVVCNAYNRQRDPGNTLEEFAQCFGEFFYATPVPLINSFQRLVSDNSYEIHASVETRLENLVKTVIGGQNA